jgi:hypothetical protein
MITINIYLKMNPAGSTVVDQDAFDAESGKPSIFRGQVGIMNVRPLYPDGSKYQLSDLENKSFEYVVDPDFDTTDPAAILVNSGITVEEYTDSDGTGAQIVIPLTSTNTEEIIALLGTTTASKAIGSELAGIEAGESDPDFIAQFDLTVKNRRSSAGTTPPTAVPSPYYTAVQIDALLATKADALPSDAITLTGGATTNIELGAVATYSVFEITVKIIDDSGDYNIMLLTCSNDGSTTALISHEGGHNSAVLARFDAVIESDVNTDILDGVQRLKLSVAAGADYTCKYQMTNRM